MTGAAPRWERDEYGSWIGYTGSPECRVFKISRPVLAGQGWTLTAKLPDRLDEVEGGPVDDLKATAERWLAEFVTSLGAVFPEPAQVPVRPGGRQLTSVDILDAFRTVTSWSDAEVLHYEVCDECNPAAGTVCEAYPLADPETTAATAARKD